MIDGKSIKRKLIGNEEQRAVSPVIGVILMVAITVILAAVIATFVMDLGSNMGGEPANAVVDSEVDYTNGEVELVLREEGNIDTFYVRGDIVDSNEVNFNFDGVGSSVTLDKGDELTYTPDDDADGTQADTELRIVGETTSGDEGIITTFEVEYDSDE